MLHGIGLRTVYLNVVIDISLKLRLSVNFNNPGSTQKPIIYADKKSVCGLDISKQNQLHTMLSILIVGVNSII